MNIKHCYLFLILCFCLCEGNVLAQTRISVKGIVQDSSSVRIPGASVRMIAGKDTLQSSTDSLGRFDFNILNNKQVSLLVRGIGYVAFNGDFNLSASTTEQLPAIILKDASNQLNEVVIKAKPVAVRMLKDTVEYNADAFPQREGDNVEDLLKQLPGVEVDNEGNVSSAGKQLTKLRVNGKDFFTSDVKEFISRLPANIIEKLQVIDDYGDKANFTGVKTGEPKKMLNLVLKDKRNRGTFANAGISGGTNKRYSANLNGNLWRDETQIGVNIAGNNTNNGTGINNTVTSGISLRDKIGKNLIINGNYLYQRNRSELSRQSLIQTVNSLGTVYNESSSQSDSRSTGHNFDVGLQSVNSLNYIQGSIRGNLNNSVSDGITSSRQTGVIRQDLQNGDHSSQRSPNLNADFSMSRHFKKPGRNLSLNINAGDNLSNAEQDQDNRIGYYDPETLVLVKDSVRNQLLDTRNHVQNVNTSFTFSEPIGNGRDSLVRKSVDFSYIYAYTHTTNDLVTSVRDDNDMAQRVDSLSNKYSSAFSTHTVGINYRYDAKRFNYSAGLSAQPNLLTGNYEGRTDKINRRGFNIAPLANLDFVPSPKTTYSIAYHGGSNAPDFSQLQPVADTRNLQNVIIGNPNLKASFNHHVNLSYRSTNPGSGSTLQLVARASAVQDQVVSNTVLIRDTLNSLKQETRYLNTGGNYSMGTNYYWSLPFSKRKYTLEFKGGLNYNRTVSYADDVKNFGKGISLNQAVSGRMNQKWLMLNTNVSYSYRNNTYSLATANANVIRTWIFMLDAKAFMFSSLNAGLHTSKTINQGFSVPGNNPFLINAFVEKTFFSRRGSLKVEGHDLLKQGNYLNRSVTDNTITESRSNQVTRYFLISLHWKLQSFPIGTGRERA